LPHIIHFNKGCCGGVKEGATDCCSNNFVRRKSTRVVFHYRVNIMQSAASIKLSASKTIYTIKQNQFLSSPCYLIFFLNFISSLSACFSVSSQKTIMYNTFLCITKNKLDNMKKDYTQLGWDEANKT
ncbi:hypothetical protein ACJX0J_017159, partial [Zea mays]